MSDENDPVYREIVSARVKMLLEMPFFGQLSTRLIAVDASSWCDTAAVDGKHLFYNREFIKNLSRPELLFLIAHECLHVVFDHLGRRNGRDPKIYNMACLGWGTMIRMADGSEQPIQRVVPGDLIASPLGATRVMGTMFSGIKPTFEYNFGLNKIRATEDHLFASTEGFMHGSKLARIGGYGYVSEYTGSKGIHPSELQGSVVDGIKSRLGCEIPNSQSVSEKERIDSEQVFLEAAQFAAINGYVGLRNSLSGGNSRRGGNLDGSNRPEEVHSTNHHSVEHLVRAFGLASDQRVLLSSSQKQYGTEVLEHSHVWLGDRMCVDQAVALFSDQEAARALFAESYGNAEETAISRCANGGDVADNYGSQSFERARVSVRAGTGQLEPVFDLITDTGVFIANGITSHNCDYIINYTLKQENIGEMPKQGLYNKDYTDEYSSEELYELLKKNSVTIKMPLDMHLELGDDAGDDEDGKSPGNGQGDVSVTVMGKDGPPKLSEADLESIRNEMKSAIIQTAQQLGAGSVPLGVRRLIDSLTSPKLDWRTMLDANIRSSIKDDYTFNRLSRRSHGCGFLLPSQDFTTRVRTAIYIDGSGSTTTQMVTDFCSEVKGIMEQFQDFELTVATFDTEIYDVMVFTPSNAGEIHLYAENFKGGGGTAFECVYKHLDEYDEEPDRIVILTDGMQNSAWNVRPFRDVLFIVHSNPHLSCPPGEGTTVHMD